MYINKIPAIVLTLSVFLAGCAAPVATNIQPSAASVSKYSEMSDIDLVAALEKNVNAAKVAGMPFLAPNYFKEASAVLSDTKNQLGNQPKAVLAKSAARGDAILNKGRAVMDIVKYRFAQELELKARIDALDAQKIVPREYQQTMTDFTRLIEKVEREQKGNIDKDKDALLRSLQHLEVHAVQEGALHDADVINAESRKQHAESQAPQTYAEAQRVFADAKQRIAAAPRDDKLVHGLGAQALFAARHAQQVNERVALLMAQLNVGASGGVSMGAAAGTAGSAMAGVQVGGASPAPQKLTLEKIVLQEEDRLQAIATALGLEDLRDQPQDKQLAQIKRAAAELARADRGKQLHEYEARLKAANEATTTARTQLAERDAQIDVLNARIAKLEQALSKPAPKHRAAKSAAKSKSKAKAVQPTK
jgi:hypothetical protein